MTGYAEKFTYKLQEHFIVVHWDQRETGKTLQLNTSSKPLSLNIFVSDTHALIDSLLQQFRKPKLYLIGHSWGTVLGFHIADKFPELLYAYVAIAPMINQLESEQIILELMKAKGVQTGNLKEIEELASVKIPFESGEQLYYHRKWLLHYNGSKTQLSRNHVLSWSHTWLALFNEASKINLIETLPVIHCPVYFFVGRKDYQTNSSIAERYYNRLTSPVKGLVWFEQSGHFIPSTEPRLLQDMIIQKVFPETFIEANLKSTTGILNPHKN